MSKKMFTMFPLGCILGLTMMGCAVDGTPDPSISPTPGTDEAELSDTEQMDIGQEGSAQIGIDQSIIDLGMPMRIEDALAQHPECDLSPNAGETGAVDMDASQTAVCAALREAIAEVSDEPSVSDGCRTYYGKCTGSWFLNTSCATGEGYYACYTGPHLYAWMTICGAYGSYPSAWGAGFCFW